MNDPVVIVTGGAHGIGAATALAFAREGERVVVADIDGAAAADVVEEIRASGGHADAIHLDASSATSWQALADSVHTSGHEARTIVNNAFTLTLAPAHELDEADWNRQLATTLGAVYHSIRIFHDDLVRQGGSLVNVASVHAVVAWPSHPAYAAAKGGMIALSRQLAIEYGPAIRSNCVAPGSISTRLWDGAGADVIAHAAGQAALGRLGRPDEVADAIVFLASERASYITGAVLMVDGGQTGKSS